jgi:hypothetical protein
MNKITGITLLGDYLLLLKFNGGESKKIDFELLIGEGISAALLDKDYFKQVALDNGGGIEWPNGMDFCANFLKEHVSADGFIQEP